MQGADPGTTIFGNTVAELEGDSLRIGIVQARFNAAVTDRIAQACLAELEELGVAAKYIEHVSVPGALEVPVALQAMARRQDFDALVAIGCVIRGETYHFELVANESGAGVTRVSLTTGLPSGWPSRPPRVPRRGPSPRRAPRPGPRSRR